MGSMVMTVCFVLAMTATAALGAVAPSPAADCSSVIYDMVDCLDYVSKGSQVSKPTKSCCTGVASVVKVSQFCLCEGLDLAATMGIVLDMARSTGLPGACNVKIPDGEHCPASPTSPSSSPAASPKQAPATPPKSSQGPTLPPPKSSSPPSPLAVSPAPPSVSDGPTPSPAESTSGGSSLVTSMVSKIWWLGLVVFML